MRVSRAFFGCLVAASCHSFLYAQNTVAESELILGPVVPLGDLEIPAVEDVVPNDEPKQVPVAGSNRIERGRRTGMAQLVVANHDLPVFSPEGLPVPDAQTEPSRVIRQPMPAPTIQMVQRATPLPQRPAIHPDQVRSHLMAAAQSLQAAGLADDANQIFSIQQRFTQDHYQNLLLTYKEGQVQMLQAEIAGLKQRQSSSVVETNVHLRLQMIRLQSPERDEFVKALAEISSSFRSADVARDPSRRDIYGLFDAETEAVRVLIDDVIRTKNAVVIAEPSATVLNGRTVHVAYEPETSTPAVVLMGQRNRVPQQNAASMFELSPHVTSAATIRLKLLADVACRLPRKTGPDNGLRSFRTRMEKVVEVKPGHSLVLVGPSEYVAASESKIELSGCDLILITPTIVNRHEAIPAPLPAPFPRVDDVRQPVIEAKVIRGANE